jgi:uncharacterized membrane protein
MDYTHRETETPGLSRYGARPSARADLAGKTNGSGLSSQSVERAHQQARALGWFSLGLGLTQVLTPGGVSRAIGLKDGPLCRLTMRALGLREITSGIGILSRPRPTGWMLARLAGDVMDVALLAQGLTSRRARKTRLPVAIASVVGVGALDYLVGRRLRQADREGLALPRARELEVTSAITVSRPPEEVYRFWRELGNLPRFMTLLDSVQVLDDRRSRWTITTPRGKTLQWESEITEDRPNERIAWRATKGAPIDTWGQVEFRQAPGGRGTEVVLKMKLDPPGGALGAALARAAKKVPEIKTRIDLRRFKQVMELGEVVVSDASAHRGPHPARPAASENDTDSDVE